MALADAKHQSAPPVAWPGLVKRLVIIIPQPDQFSMAQDNYYDFFFLSSPPRLENEDFCLPSTQSYDGEQCFIVVIFYLLLLLPATSEIMKLEGKKETFSLIFFFQGKKKLCEGDFVCFYSFHHPHLQTTRPNNNKTVRGSRNSANDA